MTAVNNEEILDTNSPLTLAEGGTGIIDAAHLETTDTDSTPVELAYNVSGGLPNGHLELTTALGVPITTFTQDDIDNNRVVYIHNGSETTSDSFGFTIDDGQGTTSAGTFNINITPVNDEETLVTSDPLSVSEGGSGLIDTLKLQTTDNDNSPAQLVYLVTGGLDNGQLELTTASGIPISTFTQDDINNNRLVYVHSGTETTSDSFDFDVDDGQGAISSDTFNIAVS